jgi:hypothetical protein
MAGALFQLGQLLIGFCLPLGYFSVFLPTSL